MKKNLIRLIAAMLISASLGSVYAAPAYETFNINETFEGYIPDGWSADEGISSVTEENGNKALKIESSENGNTVVKDIENLERFIIAEFDIFYSENTLESTYLPVFKNSDGTAILKAKIDEDGTVSFEGKKTNKTSVKLKENEWNHFRYNINMYSGIYAVAVNDEFPLKNATMAGSYPAALSSLEFVFENQGEIMIDNLILRNTGRVFADFSGGTKADLAQAGFVNFGTVALQENTELENDYYLLMSSGNPRISFPTITEYGVVEFDIMFNDVTKTRPSIIFANAYSGLHGAAVLKSGDSDALYAWLYKDETGEITETGKMTETAFSSGTWYHVRVELDIVNQKYAFLMSSDSSSEPALQAEMDFYERNTYIDSMIFESKNQKFYIDNFEVWSNEITAPIVSAVSVTGADGSQVEGVDMDGGAVPSEIESINVEFAVNDEGKGIQTDVDANSITEDAVYFIDMKENRKIKTTFSYDETSGKATMLLGEYLNVNGDYRIIATNAVKNTLGYKMSSPLKLKLQPIPEKVLADVDKATAVKTAEGIDVEIPVINYSGDEQPLKVVAIICSADGMAKQTPAMMTDAVPVSEDTYLVQKGFSTTEPAEAGDSVKLLVWDENNVPVCDEIVIAITD